MMMRRAARKIVDRALAPYFEIAYWRQRELSRNAVQQRHLSFQYQQMMHSGMPLPRFQDVGFHAFSQTDEDGYLLYIFSLIGAGDKRAVEIGAGEGTECNTANLIINHGWRALLVDGLDENVEAARR